MNGTVLIVDDKEKLCRILAKDNKKKAAELLKISRRTLYNKLEKYGIDI